jgi:hypothetical protein
MVFGPKNDLNTKSIDVAERMLRLRIKGKMRQLILCSFYRFYSHMRRLNQGYKKKENKIYTIYTVK